MAYEPQTPFDSIEGSHEYISLLNDNITEALAEVEADIALAEADGASRRKEALLLVHFKLSRLQLQMVNSGRILNDLRSLRRLLLRERTFERAMARRAGA